MLQKGKMLSGIKFIPRDQLENEEELENKKKKSKRKGRERIFDEPDNSGSSDSSDHDRRSSKKANKKGKGQNKRKEYSPDDSVGSSDGSGSGSSEEANVFKKRRGKRGKEKLLEGSSSSDDCSRRNYKSSKHMKEGRYGKDKRKMKKEEQEEELSDDDDVEMVEQVDKEIARKELGLDWMLRSGSRTVEISHGEIDAESQAPNVKEKQQPNPKELNPYLRDNGSGYPDDATIPGTGNKLLSSSVVGDGGASWRLKALKRAKEQAAREGKKLNEVVEERWGSLGELAASLSTSRAAPSHAHLHAIKERKRGPSELSEAVSADDGKGGGKRILSGRHDYLHDVSSRNPEMRRPRKDSLSWKKNKKCDMPPEDKSLISAAISSINHFKNDGSFLSKFSELENKDASNSGGPLSASMHISDHSVTRFYMDEHKGSIDASLSPKQALTANQLAAKILQLRVKGKHEEADNLSKEMEKLKKKEEIETIVEKQDVRPQSTRQQDVGSASSSYMRKQGTSNQMRREEDADRHLANIIMNKKHSLSEREEDEYGFEIAPSKKHNRRRQGIPEEKTIAKQLTTQKERCQFCFESPSRPKHLVVSIANFTYLMLPQRKPLVEGHCCIVPMQHEDSTRSIDKNVWVEIRNFKKCLLKMFATHEKDLVFLETVIALSKQRRHCLLECIPVPYEVANLAPMYFRKAIEEAEEEWGQHEMKKVIPTSGNLRQVIPENFSYFHVEFGLDKGFVHVIDDDSNFSSGFGLNVVRGLLKLPEEDMYRRRRHESEDNQRQAVMRFARDWEPFDWTTQLD